MRFSEIYESAPPGMEKWIKDRKPEFKKRYGDRWQEVLYATAWKQKNNESVEQGVAEAADPERKKLGRIINKYFGKIYDGGDDALDYLDSSAPTYHQVVLMDYEGDLDSVIAEQPIDVLKQIAVELKSVASDIPHMGFGEGLGEVSQNLRNRYVARASDDYGSANFAARASKSHPGLENYSKEQEERAKKRAAGLNRALSNKRRGVEEAGYGRSSWDSSMPDWQRREQDSWDAGRRAFKRAEMQHELGHEDHPDFERNLRQQQIDRDRGPWYIRIDGVIYKQKGVAKSFDWKRGANNYGMAMLKNNPSLAGKIFITKNPNDTQKESAVSEAEYQGRTVKLGKPMQGDVKKFKVYVRNPKTGKTIKVNFGDPNMRIKKSNPKRRKSFRARHNCSNPGPRTKARYWSCRKW